MKPYVKRTKEYFASAEIERLALEKHNTYALMNGWADFFRQHSDKKLYLFTFMFPPFRGTETQIIRTMEKVIERFYERLARRVTRSRKKYLLKIVMVAFADKPVPHEQKKAFAAHEPNRGLHFHAVVALCRKTRLKVGLKKYLDAEGAKLKRDLPFRRVHVKRIKGDPGPVVAYCLKSLERLRFSGDRTLVFPKSTSEF
jgi:hypothetical protein